jgi:hypothetical protein
MRAAEGAFIGLMSMVKERFGVYLKTVMYLMEEK